MPMVIEVLRWAHIAAGALALGVLTVPLVASKGGRTHRRVGWIYVAAMAAVAVTAILVSGWRVLFDPPRRSAALFLGYVAVLSASSASAGVRALFGWWW